MRFYVDAQEFNTNYISFSKINGTSISVSPTSNIELYPNPVTHTLFVKGVSENTDLIVYNLSGTKLLQTKGQSINIENIPNGMFFIKILDDNRLLTLKSIKVES
jgi:hypothetical protein